MFAHLDRGMVPLGRVDLQTQLVEQGPGTDLGVPRRRLRVVEEGEVVHEGQQPGTHEGSAAAEPTAGGLGGDLGGGLGGRPAAGLGVAEVLGEDLRELLEDEGAEGPALGNGREVIALAIDVQGEVVAVVLVDPQGVEPVHQVEGDPPVPRLRNDAEVLEGLHLHAANKAVTVELAEVDDQTPAGPAGLGDEEGHRKSKSTEMSTLASGCP